MCMGFALCKRIRSLFREFMIFEDDQDVTSSSMRICASMKKKVVVPELINVAMENVEYQVSVRELMT